MSENPEKPIKKSAIMTDEKAAQLALARAKAIEIAQQNRAVREKEAQAKELSKKVRAEKADQALNAATQAAQELVEKKPSKIKKIPRVVYVDSDSSSDEEVVYVKRKSKPKYVREKEPIIEQQLVRPAYDDLMTASQLKHEMSLMRRDMLRKSMFKAY